MKKEIIGFRVPKEDKQIFNEVCKEMGISVSELLRIFTVYWVWASSFIKEGVDPGHIDPEIEARLPELPEGTFPEWDDLKYSAKKESVRIFIESFRSPPKREKKGLYMALPNQFDREGEITVNLLSFYKVEGAAKLLGRSKVIVRNYCKDGIIPGAVKRGREWIIPGWGIRDYLSGGKQSSGS